MTKTDCEQHAAVWGLAEQLFTEEIQHLYADEKANGDIYRNIISLSLLTKYMAQAYTVMAESIVE